MYFLQERWKQYAFLEGLSKTASNSLVKLVGLSGGTFGSGLVATFVIGVVQMCGGFSLSVLRRKNVFPGWRLVCASVLFGLTATAITVAGLYVFTFEEADLGTVVFISLFSLVIGIFIDSRFFKTNIKPIQWFGVLVFLLGGYSMLNFPSLQELTSLPLWLLISFVIPLGIALNEGFTRWMSVSVLSDPLINNFWIGLTTALSSSLLLLLVDISVVLSSVTITFYLYAALIGVIVLVMISFKLLSYKEGGTIARKKIIMQGTHLIAAVLVGIVFFSEMITVGKLVGVVSCLISMRLMEMRVK